MNSLALPPLVAFACAYLLLAWLLRNGQTWLPMDTPNARSLHANAVPRVGGIAILVGLIGGASVMQEGTPTWLLLALVLGALSFVDDRRGLPVGLRFLVHFMVAGLFVNSTLPTLGLFWQFALVLVLVWMTNLYNFMDGSDGLAGGMALFGFGAYGMAACWGGDAALAGASLIVAAAALAFLRFNFHPARVFMGDAGSIPLGFLAAALGILGWRNGLWPVYFPVLVFSPFIVDASVTLLRRGLRGEKVWQAHKSHYYQRLVQSGLGHKATALWEYALMIASGLSALAILRWPALTLPLLMAWVLIYIGLMLTVDRRWRTYAS